MWLVLIVWIGILGEILYKEFLASVRKSMPGGGGGGGKAKEDDYSPRNASSSSNSRRKQNLSVKLDRSVMNELSKLPADKKLRQTMEDYDRKGNGKLTRENFRSALQEKCKLDLLEREWRQVLGQFDPDDKGYVNIDDFLSWAESNREEGEADAKRKGSKEEASYVGKRKGTMEPDEAVEITVHELRLTDRSIVRDLKGDDIYVAYRFLEDRRHMSESQVLRDEGEVEVGFIKTFPVPRGSDLSEALTEELTSAKGSRAITFTVYSKRGGGRRDNR